MLEADVVVGSGGMSVYEIAALGTPGDRARPEREGGRRMREFARHGTVEYLGLGTEVERTDVAPRWSVCSRRGRRREMSARGRALVDGWGEPGRGAVLERREAPRVPRPGRPR
jgi:spore coat polysaccharide biosynthesis predicted glycosyltransferase SpsG